MGPIGVFDSGYGGLTILKELVKTLPEYNFTYLGDNARAPYGNRSFETVNQYTTECIEFLFGQGCELVILACNTASAKALRNIQQNYLPHHAPKKRVLGVIRPTTEVIGEITQTDSVGILGTTGTVTSHSYPIEIGKLWPQLKVFQQACPMWVPLIENNEANSDGADFFVKKYLDELFNKSKHLDAIVLACTHYPLLINKIKHYIPEGVKVISQGELVATSLKDYLRRHPEINQLCVKQAKHQFFTTDDEATFNEMAKKFFEKDVNSTHIAL